MQQYEIFQSVLGILTHDLHLPYNAVYKLVSMEQNVNNFSLSNITFINLLPLWKNALFHFIISFTNEIQTLALQQTKRVSEIIRKGIEPIRGIKAMRNFTTDFHIK